MSCNGSHNGILEARTQTRVDIYAVQGDCVTGAARAEHQSYNGVLQGRKRRNKQTGVDIYAAQGDCVTGAPRGAPVT